MSLSSAYKTDNKKEVDGVEFNCPPNDDGTVPVFVVSRMGQTNPRYARALESAIKPFKHLQRTGELKGELAVKVVTDAFINGCLLSWRNVKYGDIVGGHNNEDAIFTPANASTLFERLPELFSDLQEFASQIANFREETIESDAKN